MDDHERPDMVKYWDNVFLLAMALYEAQMTHYEGPDLKPMEPQLSPDVKKIITYFHDECCFHALDYKKSAWSEPSKSFKLNNLLKTFFKVIERPNIASTEELWSSDSCL